MCMEYRTPHGSAAWTRIFQNPPGSTLGALINTPLKQGVNEKWWPESFSRYEISGWRLQIRPYAAGDNHNLPQGPSPLFPPFRI